MIRLAELPAAKPVEEATKSGTSPVLRFLGRVLAVVVAFFVWLFVLIGAAAMLLVHLIVAALARGTQAAVLAVLPAEAEAKDDLSRAFARLRGRAASSAHEPAKRPAA